MEQGENTLRCNVHRPNAIWIPSLRSAPPQGLDSFVENQSAWFKTQLGHSLSGATYLNYSILKFPSW